MCTIFVFINVSRKMIGFLTRTGSWFKDHKLQTNLNCSLLVQQQLCKGMEWRRGQWGKSYLYYFSASFNYRPLGYQEKGRQWHIYSYKGSRSLPTKPPLKCAPSPLVQTQSLTMLKDNSSYTYPGVSQTLLLFCLFVTFEDVVVIKTEGTCKQTVGQSF